MAGAPAIGSGCAAEGELRRPPGLCRMVARPGSTGCSGPGHREGVRMSVRQRALRSAPLIGFGLAIVFLGLSLVGYDPADPPGRGAEPANSRPTNPCGPVGAALAHALFTTLGWSCWLLLAGAAGRQPAPGPPPALSRTGSVRRSGSRWSSLVAAGVDPQAGADAPAQPAGRQRGLPRCPASRSSWSAISATPGCSSSSPRPGSSGWRSATMS